LASEVLSCVWDGVQCIGVCSPGCSCLGDGLSGCGCTGTNTTDLDIVPLPELTPDLIRFTTMPADGSLPFPILDRREDTIVHTFHCVKMATAPTSAIPTEHYLHCKNHVANVRPYQTSALSRVEKELCTSLFNEKLRSDIMDCVDDSANCLFDYQPLPSVEDIEGTVITNADTFMARLATNNFGGMWAKDFRNESLSKTETEYIRNFYKSPAALQLSAVALSCEEQYSLFGLLSSSKSATGHVHRADHVMASPVAPANLHVQLLSRTNDLKLLYPLPDFNSMTINFVHFFHCTEVVRSPDHEGNPAMKDVHMHHCARVVNAVRAAAVAADIRVDKEVCHYLLADVAQEVRSGSFCLNYLFCYADSTSSTGHASLTQPDPNHFVSNPRMYFNRLGGYNFGTMLMREWKGEPLTTAERAYFATMFEPSNLRQAAIGWWCSQLDV